MTSPNPIDAVHAGTYPADTDTPHRRRPVMNDDLTGANLTEANLREADLAGANLYRADLTGAHLAGVRGLELPSGWTLTDVGTAVRS